MSIDNPKTISEWWQFIKTDCAAFKVRYFLRNQSAIRSSVKVPCDGEIGTRWTEVSEFMEFLSSVATVKLHSQSSIGAPYGNWSIRELPGETQFEFLVRIDCDKSGRTSFIVCHANAQTESGQWVSIADK